MFIAVAGREAYEAWRADQTLLWRSTSATVLAHDAQSKARRQCIALVTYEYAVNGQTYRSDRVQFQQPADGTTLAGALAAARANFPIGETYEAFYDPSAPDQAVLIAAEGDWARVGWSVAPFALAGALIAAIMFIKRGTPSA